jgi:hypothetical protein
MPRLATCVSNSDTPGRATRDARAEC